jgi:hypothetical protein
MWFIIFFHPPPFFILCTLHCHCRLNCRQRPSVTSPPTATARALLFANVVLVAPLADLAHQLFSIAWLAAMPLPCIALSPHPWTAITTGQPALIIPLRPRTSETQRAPQSLNMNPNPNPFCPATASLECRPWPATITPPKDVTPCIATS